MLKVKLQMLKLFCYKKLILEFKKSIFFIIEFTSNGLTHTSLPPSIAASTGKRMTVGLRTNPYILIGRE